MDKTKKLEELKTEYYDAINAFNEFMGANSVEPETIEGSIDVPSPELKDIPTLTKPDMEGGSSFTLTTDNLREFQTLNSRISRAQQTLIRFINENNIQ